MATLAFVLLIGALLLFLASTRQWALWLRGVTWGAGILLLIVAWLLLGSSERDPELAAALGDLAAKWSRPGESMLLRMLESNGAMVARIILSLFDIFLFFALVVSVLALIAFRPGEELERIIRPVMMGMIGAIIGGVFALAIVGTGFGEREQRKAYAGPVRADTVHNAETLILNGDLLRLRGIDAPEPGQVCRLGARTQDCGEEAARTLRRSLQGAYVMCAVEDPVDPTDPFKDGRLATCTAVRPGGAEFNVARMMVEEGYAIGVGGSFQTEGRAALARTRGLLTWCSIQPDAWAKFTPAQKNAFRDKGVYPAGTPIMGTCPPPKATPGRRRSGATTPVVDAPD